MRRLLVGACAVLLLASFAGAGVQGYPDTATITAFTGAGNTIGGSGGGGADPTWAVAIAMTAPRVLPFATTPGTANRVTLAGAGNTVQIDFTWSSGYVSGFWKTQTPNLAIYLGVVGSRQAVEASGNLNLVAVDYDIGAGFGSNTNLLSGIYPGGAGGIPAFVSYHTVGNAPGSPSQIVGVRLTLSSLAASTSFWIGAIQNPEPGTFALFGLGLAGAGFIAVRRRRRSKKV
jgi:PEP-CTERM motif